MKHQKEQFITSFRNLYQRLTNTLPSKNPADFLKIERKKKQNENARKNMKQILYKYPNKNPAAKRPICFAITTGNCSGFWKSKNEIWKYIPKIRP